MNGCFDREAVGAVRGPPKHVLMNATESICPGCGLAMPRRTDAFYDGDYNNSPECWEVFTEVIGKEFGNAVLFGQVHQLTVDAYATQHAGGRHSSKSVVIHLCGLHLVIDRGVRPPQVPPLFQQLASVVRVWPCLPRPSAMPSITVFDVALAESVEDHVKLVREWSESVWEAWSSYHPQIRNFVRDHLDKE